MEQNSEVVKKYMPNKQGKFDTEIFFCCVNDAIFVLVYFSELPCS